MGSAVQHKLRHIFLLLTLVLIGQAKAQVGNSTYAFLDLPFSARLNSLGSTNVSVRDGDISMALQNPALLGSRTDGVLQFNYAYYAAGLNFASFVYGHNFSRYSSKHSTYLPASEIKDDKPNYFAVGIHYLDYGKFQYADETGTRSGDTFTAKDICINAMYARQLGEHFSVGVNLKPVVSIYERYTAFALGADVGGHFQTCDSTFQLGLSLQNIGWQLKGFYSEEGGQHREKLPLNLVLGFNYRFKHAPLRLGMTIHNMQRWNLGYENASTIKWYDMLFRHTIFYLDIIPRSDRFYITLSYNHRRRMEMQITDQRSLAGFALGAGVRIYKFNVGFAISQYVKSNFVYQFTLSADINAMLK